jgi:hypothetical protein
MLLNPPGVGGGARDVPNSTPIHVLMVQDVEADAELKAIQLRQAGLAFDWPRVATEAG